MNAYIPIILIYWTLAIITLIVLLLNIGAMGREQGDIIVAITLSLLFPITWYILVHEYIKDSKAHHKRWIEDMQLDTQDDFKVRQHKHKLYIDIPDKQVIINTKTYSIKERSK